MQSIARVSRVARTVGARRVQKQQLLRQERAKKTWEQKRNYSSGHQRINLEDEALYSKNPVENLPPELYVSAFQRALEGEQPKLISLLVFPQM